VLILGAIALTGALCMSYEQGAELLNFGAFIAFIGVNVAALVHYKFRSKERVLFPFLVEPEREREAAGRGVDVCWSGNGMGDAKTWTGSIRNRRLGIGPFAGCMRSAR
jgi:hypothetical protein